MILGSITVLLGAVLSVVAIRVPSAEAASPTDNSIGQILVTPPSTDVLLPSNGATVTKVQYELTGGTLSDAVIATASSTY
jgi:hypothetical protein